MLALTLLAGTIFLTAISADQVRDTRATPSTPGPTGSGTITGLVTTADTTNRPIRLANIVLIGATTGTLRVTSTDDSGAFTITNLPADRYTIGASKLPYLGAVAGARRAARTGGAIVLADNQKISDVAIRLYPGGSISGTVTTEDGQPAAFVAIVLQLRRLEGATRTFTQDGAPVMTDDRGRFRFFGLAPGEYVVASSGSGRSSARQLTDAEVDAALKGAPVPLPSTPDGPLTPGSALAYASVFYPGTTRLNDAVPIRLAAGEDREGIDFRLMTARVARVSGTVATDDGRPLETADVLISTSPEAALSFNARIRVGPDGRFAMGGVVPGTYTASALGTGSQAGYFAVATVEIDGVDQSLQLTLQPPLKLAAQLVFDGAAPPVLAGRRVPFESLTPLSNAARPQVSISNPSGVFTITNLIPGRYLLGGPLFFGASTDSVTWSLMSVMVDGMDVTDLPITLGSDPLPKSIVVTYGDRWQELSGRLSLASGAAATDYTMIVFPANKAYWLLGSRRIRTTQPGTNGEYTLSGPGPLTLPPGEYLLAAVTDLERNEEFDPGLLASLIPAAVPVSLQPGQRKVQDLVVK